MRIWRADGIVVEVDSKDEKAVEDALDEAEDLLKSGLYNLEPDQEADHERE